MVTVKHMSRGYSLVEVLLYVAILATMSVVLVNFFLVSVQGKSEHSARDDLESLEGDIQLALDADIASAVNVIAPLPNASSTSLVLVGGVDGTTTWSVVSGALTRQVTAGTRSFGLLPARVNLSTFRTAASYQSRLGATTTLIQYQVDISHAKENISRSLTGSRVLGNQGL